MSKMKRILFFIPEYSSGGAEQTVRNLITYMKMYCADYEVYECIMHEPAEKVKDIHLYVMKHDTKLAKSIMDKFRLKIGQICELHRLKKKLKIDICVSFLFGADTVNVLSQFPCLNTKSVISLRNNLVLIYDKLPFLKKRLWDINLKRADYIVALSQSVENAVIERFPNIKNKITSIHNPVPCSSVGVCPDLIKKLRQNEKKIITTAGRLTFQKGQWRLIKMMKLLKEKSENIELIILGKGELENRLKELATELDVIDKIHFLGFVNNANDYIYYSDIFVFPSLFEGLGNVLIEAISLGKVVISSDCPFGPREILAPNTEFKECKEVEYAQYGVLVPNGVNDLHDHIIRNDEVMFAEAILSVISDNGKMEYYEKAAQERAETFAPRVIVKKWDKIFTKLTGRKG